MSLSNATLMNIAVRRSPASRRCAPGSIAPWNLETTEGFSDQAVNDNIGVQLKASDIGCGPQQDFEPVSFRVPSWCLSNVNRGCQPVSATKWGNIPYTSRVS